MTAPVPHISWGTPSGRASCPPSPQPMAILEPSTSPRVTHGIGSGLKPMAPRHRAPSTSPLATAVRSTWNLIWNLINRALRSRNEPRHLDPTRTGSPSEPDLPRRRISANAVAQMMLPTETPATVFRPIVGLTEPVKESLSGRCPSRRQRGSAESDSKRVALFDAGLWTSSLRCTADPDRARPRCRHAPGRGQSRSPPGTCAVRLEPLLSGICVLGAQEQGLRQAGGPERSARTSPDGTEAGPRWQCSCRECRPRPSGDRSHPAPRSASGARGIGAPPTGTVQLPARQPQV